MTTTQNKKVYYHGTSADNLKSILKHGISCNEEKIWNVSADSVYLWDVEKVAEAWELQDEDSEYKEQRAFQMAFESAQFACITSKDCRAIVIKIELDETEVGPDLSSENMQGQGAVCIDRNILPAEILEIKVSDDLSLLRGWFISMAMANEYCNMEFSPLEKKVAQAMQKAEIYPDDIDDMITWEEIGVLESISH